jgi:hypothetical protein
MLSTLVKPNRIRLINLGQKAVKSTGTLAATTVPLFTITGRVGLTCVSGIVTTKVSVANAYQLQSNPTVATGTTSVLCATLDIGTTDTEVGTVLSITGLATDAMVRGGAAVEMKGTIVVPTGQIEHISAGTDGVIQWSVFWVPLEPGSTLVAA